MLRFKALNQSCEPVEHMKILPICQSEDSLLQIATHKHNTIRKYLNLVMHLFISWQVSILINKLYFVLYPFAFKYLWRTSYWAWGNQRLFSLLPGLFPGAGGSQRLPRAIGKSRAMEMNLTGTPITAQMASDWGLVSKVVPAAELVDEAVKTADVIAGNSKIAVIVCKNATNAAYESSLQVSHYLT